ncbi:hypothetical protein BB561_002533, partial [Smittium simulii]
AARKISELIKMTPPQEQEKLEESKSVMAVFYQKVNEIEEIIRILYKNITEISSIQNQNLGFNYMSNENNIKKRVEALRENADKKLFKVVDLLKEMESYNNTTIVDVGDNAIRRVNPKIKDEDLRVIIDKDDGSGEYIKLYISQSNNKNSNANFQDIVEKNLDIKKLEESIKGLSLLFQEMELLVYNQQKFLDNIENAVEKTKIYTVKSSKYLDKASEYSRRRNRILFGITGLFFILLLVAGITIFIVLQHHSETQNVSFTQEEIVNHQLTLNKKLPPEIISYRNGPGGKLAYVEGWRLISIANEVFGYNGWSSSILNITVDDIKEFPDGRVNVCVSALVRVSLRDGTFHEDVGYGSIDNARSKAMALEKSKKEAATDGLKRALRMFGNLLGNCVYDKGFVASIKNHRSKIPPVSYSDANFYRPNVPNPLNNQVDTKPSNPTFTHTNNQKHNINSSSNNSNETPAKKSNIQDRTFSEPFSDNDFEWDESFNEALGVLENDTAFLNTNKRNNFDTNSEGTKVLQNKNCLPEQNRSAYIKTEPPETPMSNSKARNNIPGPLNTSNPNVINSNKCLPEQNSTMPKLSFSNYYGKNNKQEYIPPNPGSNFKNNAQAYIPSKHISNVNNVAQECISSKPNTSNNSSFNEPRPNFSGFVPASNLNK